VPSILFHQNKASMQWCDLYAEDCDPFLRVTIFMFSSLLCNIYLQK
jgi:hypothetical protein